MLVQSKLHRPDGTVIDLHGKKHHFKPNDKGHHVCEIDDPKTLHRLVKEIPEGYKLYEPDAVLPALAPRQQEDVHPLMQQSKNPAVPTTMVISNGEESIDLMALDIEQLRTLAKETFDLRIHHKWSDQTIREKIVEATRKPE